MSELFLETLNKFDSQLYPNFPNSFWIQYDILISIYCFGALFGIAGLIVRICKKQFWWLRIEMTSNGKDATVQSLSEQEELLLTNLNNLK